MDIKDFYEFNPHHRLVILRATLAYTSANVCGNQIYFYTIESAYSVSILAIISKTVLMSPLNPRYKKANYSRKRHRGHQIK